MFKLTSLLDLYTYYTRIWQKYYMVMGAQISQYSVIIYWPFIIVIEFFELIKKKGFYNYMLINNACVFD